jgi:hypothetical protein
LAEFENSTVCIEFSRKNNQIIGTMHQFLINKYKEEKTYNMPITGYIDNKLDEIVISTNSKNLNGVIKDNSLLINWDSLIDGNIKSITFNKSNITEYSNIIEKLKTENLENIEAERINQNIESIENDLSFQIESLKDKVDSLNKTKFVYNDINKALEKVKIAYNEYYKATKDKKRLFI